MSIPDNVLEQADEFDDEKPDIGWTCPECGRWHPTAHEECWHCYDEEDDG